MPLSGHGLSEPDSRVDLVPKPGGLSPRMRVFEFTNE